MFMLQIYKKARNLFNLWRNKMFRPKENTIIWADVITEFIVKYERRTVFKHLFAVVFTYVRGIIRIVIFCQINHSKMIS